MKSQPTLFDAVAGSTPSLQAHHAKGSVLPAGAVKLKRSITVIEAPAHRGKTLLTLEMAICLDFELPLFGRFQPLRNRRVFYVGADAPSWDYGLQTRKLLIGHGIEPPRWKLLDTRRNRRSQPL